MADNEVTSEGTRLINHWLDARSALETAKHRVVRVECDVENTKNALAKWMLPDDAKPGEKIAIWHGDSLVQVEVTEHDPIVTVRTRGKGMALRPMGQRRIA